MHQLLLFILVAQEQCRSLAPLAEVEKDLLVLSFECVIEIPCGWILLITQSRKDVLPFNCESFSSKKASKQNK